MLYGIDISHYNDTLAQKVINTEEVGFCMIKVSEGTSWRDSCAKEYAELCNMKNIPVFFYHYCRPDINKRPELEVNNFLLAAQDAMRSYPEIPAGLAIDWEQKSIGYELWLKDFVKVLRDNSACTPIIYCSQSIVAKVGSFIDIKTARLWVAHWGREGGRPGSIDPWNKWTFHQYGISNGIDRNVFNGGSRELIAYTDYWIPEYVKDEDPGDGKHCCCCSCGDECTKVCK